MKPNVGLDIDFMFGPSSSAAISCLSGDCDTDPQFVAVSARPPPPPTARPQLRVSESRSSHRYRTSQAPVCHLQVYMSLGLCVFMYLWCNLFIFSCLHVFIIQCIHVFMCSWLNLLLSSCLRAATIDGHHGHRLHIYMT